jgi:hypothetical protein
MKNTAVIRPEDPITENFYGQKEEALEGGNRHEVGAGR